MNSQTPNNQHKKGNNQIENVHQNMHNKNQNNNMRMTNLNKVNIRTNGRDNTMNKK